jgi:LacI family transcriptional regulator
MCAMRHPVTIRDVAARAEVHPGTVSRALNEQTRALVNEETAARVLRAADELGYRPNPIARGLKTNRSFTVGVLIPDLTNPLFPPIVRGIEDRLADAGYTPLVVNTDNDPERERSHLDAMLARQVDGLIAATARLDVEPLAEAVAGGIPLVLVNRSFEDDSISAVTVDDRRGVALAVEHVVGLGHRLIGHIAGPQNVSTGHQRHQGFLAAMAVAGLEVGPEHVSFGGSFTESEGARACAEVLHHAPRVTAIIAANDRLAMGCYDVLADQGLDCPGDVSVVGFNDMPFIERLSPPLTSVRVPQREMGTIAADILLAQLTDGAPPPPSGLLLEPALVVRASTAPPSAGARRRPPR